MTTEAQPAGIGDVNGDKRGAGARYNSGKPPFEFIPIRVLAEARAEHASLNPSCRAAGALLDGLAQWQKGEYRAAHILQLVDDEDLAEAAFVFEYGAKKYAAWNWAKGMPWSVPAACAVRHCLAILRGEENDPESGRSHFGHVVCNIIMLAHYEYVYPEGDDRPIKWLTPAEKSE